MQPPTMSDADRLCLACPVPDDCNPDHELCLRNRNADPALLLAAHVLAALDLWSNGLRRDALAMLEQGLRVHEGGRATLAAPKKRRSDLDWRLMDRLRHGPVAVRQIRMAMPNVNRTALAEALYRLTKSGSLVRLERGVYDLAQDDN